MMCSWLPAVLSQKNLRWWALACVYGVLFMFMTGCLFLNLLFGTELNNDEISRWLLLLFGTLAVEFIVFEPIKILLFWLVPDLLVIPLIFVGIGFSLAWLISCIDVIGDSESNVQQFVCYLSVVH